MYTVVLSEMERNQFSIPVGAALGSGLSSKYSVQQGSEKEEDGYIHMNPKETKKTEPPDMVKTG